MTDRLAALVPSALATPFTTMMLTYRSNMTTAKVSCGCLYEFKNVGKRRVVQGARMRCRDHGLQTVTFVERSFEWAFPRPHRVTDGGLV